MNRTSYNERKINSQLVKIRAVSAVFPSRPSYLVDLLSLSLVGAVKARNYMRSSFSQRVLSMTRTWIQDLVTL